jgi:hypothetical protein
MAESPLAKKLRMKPGSRILIWNAPKDYLRERGTLPQGLDHAVVRVCEGFTAARSTAQGPWNRDPEAPGLSAGIWLSAR